MSLKHFYLLCTPGCEQIVIDELNFRYPDFPGKVIEINRGGIEIESDNLNAILSLNIYMKSINRILLRLNEFKCRDFPKLYKKTMNISWRFFFTLGQIEAINLKVSSQSSRLIQTKKIEDTIYKAIQTSIKAEPPKKNAIPFFNPNLIITLKDDQCRININLSGDHLHKRSPDPIINQAPLRETIASSILIKIIQTLSPNESISLFDPMCGSATFLTEARSINKKSYRSFIFENNPKFNIYEPRSFYTPFVKLKGADINQEIINQLHTKNLDVDFVCNDFFNAKLDPSDTIIFNPPYGKRLKIENDFYNKILKKLKEARIQNAFVLTNQVKIKQSKSILEMKHGGLKVYLHHFQQT